MYITEAMELLGVTYNTLKTWAKQGRLRRWQDSKGKWIYNDDDVYAMVGKQVSKDSWVVTYSRVAGTDDQSRRLMAEQQELMHRWCAARGLSVERSYEDWSPSTEYSLQERPGLHLLLQDIIQRKVSAVVIETPCRLARVGRELFEQICRYYGVSLNYVNRTIQRPEYLLEQEKDLVLLLQRAKIDRLGDLKDVLPKPVKPRLKDPGKIVADWEGALMPPGSREISDLGDLM